MTIRPDNKADNRKQAFYCQPFFSILIGGINDFSYSCES